MNIVSKAMINLYLIVLKKTKKTSASCNAEELK
jgi:hypothetical protein